MTTGFLTVPIMRILHVSILAGLLLTINADVENPECETIIKVHRNTAYRESLGKTLRINCSVSFCNNQPPPTITWHRVVNLSTVPVNVTNNGRIQTQWNTNNDLEGTSFLIFEKTLNSDAGTYQCQGGDSVGHEIKIHLYEDGQHINTTATIENKTMPPPELTDGLMMYLYTAAGILAFVIVVIIISVASMHGCKGKAKKKETQTENQYIAIPMAERPLQSSVRGSPSAPPPRRSARRKPPPSQPSEPPLPRNPEHASAIHQGNGQRERSATEDEGGTIVYAALNHQSLEGAAARPRIRPTEEWSEYAAICVKDHQTGQGR